MRPRTVLALLALVAAVLFAVPSHAEGIAGSRSIATASEEVREWTWTGAFIDLGAGGQASILDLNAAIGEGSAGLNGLGAWDWVGNARAGFSIQPKGSPLVFGAFVGYSLGSVTTEAGLSMGGDSAGIEAEITPTWDVGAFAGIVGPNKSLLYAGYKYSAAEFDLRGTGQAAPMFDDMCAEVLHCSRDLSGHGLIAGFKMPVTPAFVLGLEYGYTRYDTEGLLRGIEGASLDLDAEVHTVMLRGSVQVGPNLFGNW